MQGLHVYLFREILQRLFLLDQSLLDLGLDCFIVFLLFVQVLESLFSGKLKSMFVGSDNLLALIPKLADLC
ncbi:hypothetical protein SDC9_50815 [bioreactor metagenome]|uniref:Uncharacterized protein n=1 Tax=bioreactor metagenome TaxID=1076179 RepID=A0A644WLS9_9ZZZZ